MQVFWKLIHWEGSQHSLALTLLLSSLEVSVSTHQVCEIQDIRELAAEDKPVNSDT